SDHAHTDFPLRKQCFLSARERHVAGESDLTAVASRTTANERDRHDRCARDADQDVWPSFETGGSLWNARQIFDAPAQIGVVQKHAFDGALEDDDPELRIALDL